MIDDADTRWKIARKLGRELDDFVRDRMEGLVEEPDITSRVGQRLEDRFDGKVLQGYKVRVATETITSHGQNSLERPLGTDLYFAISVQDRAGNVITKGLLVQAKRKDKLDRKELADQCDRMKLVTKKGSVAWLYTQNGIEVVRSVDVDVPKARLPVFGIDTLFDRIFECELGDLRKVPGGKFGDHGKLRSMIEALGARNAVRLGLKEQK